MGEWTRTDEADVIEQNEMALIQEIESLRQELEEARREVECMKTNLRLSTDVRDDLQARYDRLWRKSASFLACHDSGNAYTERGDNLASELRAALAEQSGEEKPDKG